MIKRQWRMERIVAVEREYFAAVSASNLLRQELIANPNYGNPKWEHKDGAAYRDNLETTYLVRMYAEFEATLRDYWLTHMGRTTRPPMEHLLNQSIPNQQFPRDWIENADEVRKFRNYLVHDFSEEPPDDVVRVLIAEAKQHLCRYVSCLEPSWK